MELRATSVNRRPTDQALVRRCLANDQDACADLVHRYRRMVHAVVWRITHDRSHTDDLVQETFIRVFCGLPHFGARSKLSTWIHTIAWRVAVDHQRFSVGRAHGCHFYRAGDETRAAANPEHLMVQRETALILREELDLLADRYRLPLLHVAIRGRRYVTVSHLLGLPLGTVKANIFYAKGLLRKRLQQRLQRPGFSFRPDARSV